MTALTPMAFAEGHSGERGRDGDVKVLYWQAPSILNPFLSGGTKDVESASLIVEPLARFIETGEMVPWLVDEVPTVANGGVSEDLTTITWKITEGLKWSDGTPFTSADVKFTAEYCMHPEGGCAQGATGESGILDLHAGLQVSGVGRKVRRRVRADRRSGLLRRLDNSCHELSILGHP